jgi:type VI secretion system VasD/TssJ family lipoprotein
MKTSLPIISLLLFLNGCANVLDAVSKTAQVIADPSLPVGAPEAQATKISLSLHATPDVNPNPYQEPKDLVLSVDKQEIYVKPVHNINLVSEADPPPLTADEQINEALAASGKLTAEPNPDVDPEATPIAFKVIQLKDQSLLLQADYEGIFADIEKTLGTTYLGHDDYVLLPGEFSYIEPTALAENTRYIGITAAYNNADEAEWKAIIKIKPAGHEYALFVELGKQAIQLKKQEQ